MLTPAQQAIANQCQEREAEIERLRLETACTRAQSRRSGARTVPTGVGQATGGETDFESAVAALVEAGTPKRKAISRIVKERPDLHADFLANANARRR